jgi:plasmid stabilization system protein ParE
MGTEACSVRADTKKVKQLDRIAKQQDRSRNYIVSQLEEHPGIGRTGRVRGTYELVIHDLPNIVTYRIRKQEIHILSVYHTSIKWPEAFD